MIIPMPTYTSSHYKSSHYERCIDSSELKDIREKILLDTEQLTQDEVARISQCMDEREQANSELVKLVLGIFGVFAVVIIGVCIICLACS